MFAVPVVALMNFASLLRASDHCEPPIGFPSYASSCISIVASCSCVPWLLSAYIHIADTAEEPNGRHVNPWWPAGEQAQGQAAWFRHHAPTQGFSTHLRCPLVPRPARFFARKLSGLFAHLFWSKFCVNLLSFFFKELRIANECHFDVIWNCRVSVLSLSEPSLALVSGLLPRGPPPIPLTHSLLHPIPCSLLIACLSVDRPHGRRTLVAQWSICSRRTRRMSSTSSCS